ncbi:hypothetical protein L1887_25806 [Cichorium endivia]|nr:hypothetical protein L1887_25806 [Cichorium endivia]
MMRPLSFDIQIQETEIEAAKWMPLEEYAASLKEYTSCTREQGLRKHIIELIANVERGYSGFSPSHEYDNQSCIYFNKSDLEKKKRL